MMLNKNEERLLKTELKSVFTEGLMKVKNQNRLMRLGFKIEEGKTHFKIRYKNYMYTVSKTPSDGRSGKNLACIIIKDLKKDGQEAERK